MRRALVLAFTVVFAFCLFHFYFAEDHCPVHCPSRAGRVGHVPPHHSSGETCLCFWASMSVPPEPVDIGGASGLVAVMAAPAEGRPLVSPAADIAHPPKPLCV